MMGPGSNVVLITVDTLRKDHLPIYGYPHDTAPFLSEFARDSIVFDRMYSQYVSTPPSMASLMTGRYPSFIGTGGWNPSTYYGMSRFYEPGETGVPASLPTIGERFKGAGFDTAGFVARNVHLYEPFGFSRGIDHFDIPRTKIKTRATEIVAKATKWLEPRGREPFFLWLHFMDVHAPIALTRLFSRAFLRDPLSGRSINSRVSRSVVKMQLEQVQKGFDSKMDPGSVVDLGDGQNASLEEVMDRYEGLYDGAIHFLDMCLENLFSYFKRRGLYDRTLWVFTSDHGEEFLEEGYIGHNSFSHGPLRLVQVPFILRPPGRVPGARGKRVSGTARLVDVFPTLMEAAGLPCPDSDGASLWPMIAGKVEPKRLQHMNLMAEEKLHIIYADDVKYVCSLEIGWERMTDLRTGKAIEGPSEEPGGLLERFRAERDRFLERTRSGHVRAPAPPLDAGMRSHLRALGYID